MKQSGVWLDVGNGGPGLGLDLDPKLGLFFSSDMSLVLDWGLVLRLECLGSLL